MPKRLLKKTAMGHFLDGKVSAVVGTHTHVQTADEQILPKGTAYLTDIGMTGPVNSVIGMKPENGDPEISYTNAQAVRGRFWTRNPSGCPYGD